MIKVIKITKADLYRSPRLGSSEKGHTTDIWPAKVQGCKVYRFRNHGGSAQPPFVEGVSAKYLRAGGVKDPVWYYTTA